MLVVVHLFLYLILCFFFFSSRRRHTRYIGDWSSDVCSSDLSHQTISGNDRQVYYKSVAGLERRRALINGQFMHEMRDRKSVVSGKRGDVGGGGRSKKK